MRLAVIGAGQLARMMAEPASAMEVSLRLLAESADASAAQVIVDTTVGQHTDLSALEAVVEGCAAVTFDHEHVPTEHLHALQRLVPVRPGPEALEHAQDKSVMRRRLDQLGLPSPRHAVVENAQEIRAFGVPCVLKAARGGYDGKGVWFVRGGDELEAVCAEAFSSGQVVLAEELVDFRRELSALVARSPSGEMVSYPVVETNQRDGICREVIAPAPELDPALAARAREIATVIASTLQVTGILAVELFETGDGRVLVNELAMRPHNTGHWTQDGAVTSQFENHLRAVLDLPLGAPDTRARWTVMANILPVSGAVRPQKLYRQVTAQDPSLRVHLYGKESRAGRKVGHVNAYGEDLEDCLQRARQAAAWLAGEHGEESERG